MYAKKENKVYTVNENSKTIYLSKGYDIYEGNKLIEKSPKSTVSYEEYKKVLEENKALKSKK